MVKAFRMAVGFAFVLGSTGCGSDTETAAPVMPDVTGLSLDVALSDIERAGVVDEVEVIGGGIIEVSDEPNWQVCDQLPALGEVVTDAPRLTVDRSCESDTPEPTTPPTAVPESTPVPAAPEPATIDTVQMDAYQVVGGLDDWQTDTAVCDIMKPFVLTGILTMSFTGGLAGTYEYAGGPFGAAGTGTYEISLPNGPGRAGTMTGTGEGSVDTPLGEFSDSGTEEYILTPVAPCE